MRGRPSLAPGLAILKLRLDAERKASSVLQRSGFRRSVMSVKGLTPMTDWRLSEHHLCHDRAFALAKGLHRFPDDTPYGGSGVAAHGHARR